MKEKWRLKCLCSNAREEADADGSGGGNGNASIGKPGGLVRWALDRLELGVDDLLQDTFAAVALEVEGRISTAEQAFLVYQKIWATELETISREFLHEATIETRNTKKNLVFDISPIHLIMAQIGLPGGDLNPAEVTALARRIYTSQSDMEAWLAGPGTKISGLDLSLLEVLPPELLPSEKSTQLLLLFRLLSIPPLHLLGDLYELVRGRLREATKNLGNCFGVPISPVQLPGRSLLFFSSMPLDSHFLDRHPLDELLADEALTPVQARLGEIAKRAMTASVRIPSNGLCPSCGYPHGEIEVPKTAVEFRLIMDQPDVARAIGMRHFREVIQHWRSRAASNLRAMLNFKAVKAPHCLVVVEGDSEAIALPIIALRLNIHLPSNGILIFNANGKSGVERHFAAHRANHPSLAMACLVDKDAEAWALDATRTISNAKELDRYLVVSIAQGDFEDLFERATAVETLNFLYPGTPAFIEGDFPETSRFANIAKKQLWEMRQVEFDKLEFARTIALRVPAHKIPSEIRSFLDQIVRLALARSDAIAPVR